MVRAASRNLVTWLLLSVVLFATLERHPVGERHPASERLGASVAAASAQAGAETLDAARGPAAARGEHGFCVACFLAAAAVGAPGAAPRTVPLLATEPLGSLSLRILLASADLGASSPRGPPRA
jgi:hypothetical protein